MNNYNDINNIIEDILSTSIQKKEMLNNKYTNFIWLIHTNKDKFIVRQILNDYTAMSTLRKIYKKLVPVSTSFKNELDVYKSLSKHKTNNFKHPKLIHSDSKSFIIIEYVDHEVKKSNVKYLDIDAFTKALVEFQTLNIFAYQTFNFKNVWLKILRNVSLSIFRFSATKIRKVYGFKISCKCIHILSSSLIALRRNNSVNLHLDLSCKRDGQINNIMINKDNEVYFFDFENTVREKNWILVDIIDICWSEELRNPNMQILSTYLKNMNKIYPLEIRTIKIQLRVALLRRAMRMLFSPSVVIQDKKNWENFLLETILSNKSYDIWYTQNVASYIKF